LEKLTASGVSIWLAPLFEDGPDECKVEQILWAAHVHKKEVQKRKLPFSMGSLLR